jgi:ribosomal protein S18 acetylase RimI-like enzyme
MTLRPFKLPADVPVLVDLIPPSFQYPENEAWSVQQDEIEGMLNAFNGIKRIWPLIRLLQLVSPPMRDAILGFVWEEDGKAVGLSNITRKGSSQQWEIGNVSVLPDYRRRGIARQLVAACIDLARQRGATAITLDVIAGNTPAYTLYTSLGFDHFSGFTQMDYHPNGAVAERPLPEGYTFEPVPLTAWRLPYELAQRITPEAVRKYAPVEEGRFRRPWLLYVIAPLIFRAMGGHPYQFVLRQNGTLVATVSIETRQRAGGTNGMSVTLDPACPEIAPFLVQKLVAEIQRRSPGRRIEFLARHWQPALKDAALAAGFTARVEMHSLGMRV